MLYNLHLYYEMHLYYEILKKKVNISIKKDSTGKFRFEMINRIFQKSFSFG